jgi:hypothetical protein
MRVDKLMFDHTPPDDLESRHVVHRIGVVRPQRCGDHEQTRHRQNKRWFFIH